MTDQLSSSGAVDEPRPPAEQDAPNGSAEPGAGQPTTESPSPWSAAGYSYYNPAGQATQPVAAPAEQPAGFPQAGYQQQGGYVSYPPPPTGSTGPVPPVAGTATYPVGMMAGAEPPRRPRATGLVAGIAVLALVVGGAAGALGGYLVASHDNDSNSVANSLNQPLPAAQTANAPTGSIQAVANQVLPVVVEIAAEFASGNGGANGDTGSGIIISSDGDILTNNHVIAQAANGGRIQVIFASGQTVNATVVGRDPTTDIAVIKAQGVTGLPTAQLGRSDDLQVGQPVVAIGAPFQLAGTVTSGIVSSLHRPTAAGDGGSSSQTTVLDAIQTDAPINPGNSGGPLVNMAGQVIGINSAIYSPSSANGGGLQGSSQGGNVGIGFAIPIDQAKRTATQITQTGKAIQTVLGVQVTDNVPTSGGQPGILPSGALIKQVTPGGPADKAGLKAGDVVVKANDRAVSSSDGLVAAVHAAAPGDQMKLTLSDGSTVTVTLSGQPVPLN